MKPVKCIILVWMILSCAVRILAQVTFIDTAVVENQARDCVWSEDGNYFAIPNKNGLEGDPDEVQIWEVPPPYGNQPDMAWPFPGLMTLDYGWCGDYLAICGCSDYKTVVIYDISLDDSWRDNEVASFCIQYKCHQMEWSHNGNYLICEALDDTGFEDDSDLVVYNCMYSDPSEWSEIRFIDTPFQTDKQEMYVSSGSKWLSFESHNQHDDHMVHIWNISSNKPVDWYQEYVKTGQMGGHFSPSGNYFVTEDAVNDNVYIYRTSDGSLVKQMTIPADGPVFHPDTDDTGGLNSGFLALAGNRAMLTVNIEDWSITYSGVMVNSAGCRFSPSGDLVAVYEGYGEGNDRCAIYNFDYIAGVAEVPEGERISAAAAPNPFNGGTFINYCFPGHSGVKIDIYSAAGGLIRNLVDTEVSGKRERIFWDGRNNRGELVDSGVYFCRIASPDYSTTIKTVVTR